MIETSILANYHDRTKLLYCYVMLCVKVTAYLITVLYMRYDAVCCT